MLCNGVLTFLRQSADKYHSKSKYEIKINKQKNRRKCTEIQIQHNDALNVLHTMKGGGRDGEKYDDFNKTGIHGVYEMICARLSEIFPICHIHLISHVLFTVKRFRQRTRFLLGDAYMHVHIKHLVTVYIRHDYAYVSHIFSTLIFTAFSKLSFSFDLLLRPNNSQFDLHFFSTEMP